MPPFEEYIEEIKSLWDSRWLTNMGDKHNSLEHKLAEYLDAPYVSLFTNGHIALEAAIMAMGLRGEIITTPFTFASTTQAIVRTGNTPVFCDIKTSDYTIDAHKIEALINENTVGIMPVHVYGNICEYEKIESLAKKYSLKIIYDAAHAFGVKQNDMSIAHLGDISMYSFHATKVYHTIEGGALTYSDDSLVNEIKTRRNFGFLGSEDIQAVGMNGKMSEFQAAMGLCNLRYIDDYIDSRKEAYNRYIDRLSSIKGIRINRYPADVTPNYAYLPAVFDGYKYNREEVLNRLAQNGIGARRYFYPLTNTTTVCADCANDTPTAKYIAERVLTLPLYDGLTIAQVDMVCNIILE
jgi:dTDP-4-amino-4,6-dideoxygalactose transaminase